MPLVEIASGRSSIRLDLAYARADNVTGKPIYAQARCYLHPAAAALLDRAAELARPHGLRLKIFDAYRPTEAQWVLWNAFPDPEFVADPRRGSPHSRGVAVDLTLIHAARGGLGWGLRRFHLRLAPRKPRRFGGGAAQSGAPARPDDRRRLGFLS